MQEPTKSKSLSELRQDIQDLKSMHLNLVHYQEEYKEKVGSTNDSQNVLFHPKALEVELNDIKDHFNDVEQNYLIYQSKEKFLQYMLQDPPLQITPHDIREIENQNKSLKEALNGYMAQIVQLKKDIKSITESIAKVRSKSFSRADATSKVLDDIDSMDAELTRIKLLLAQKSDLTEVDAQRILSKQSQAMAEINKIMDKKEITIRERKWKVEDLEIEVKKLRAAKDAIIAEEAVKLNSEKDFLTEQHYLEYNEATDMCNRMFGIESIQFESIDLAHIKYAEPLNTTLHIYIDPIKQTITTASMTGTIVVIDDIVNIAKQLNSDIGIKFIMFETLTRLEKKQQTIR